jgi:guanylate cyclase
VRELWQRLMAAASHPGDGEELRMQKRLQITMSVMSVPAVAFWGASFLAFGRLDAALLPFAYSVGTSLMLVQLVITRRYDLFRAPHTGLVMLGPFALHWYLGGFLGSGGAALWSLLAPVGAMMFVGVRSSVTWFAVLVALLLAGAVREAFYPAAHPLAPEQASFYFAFNTMGLAVFMFFSMRHFVSRLAVEKERSERLLLNVLPRAIADQLKREERVVAERFDSVSVLFSDLVGFTTLSQTLPATAVVELLNEIFTGFDHLAEQHGLEKIKTIGDAYMVAGGLPEPAPDHAVRIAGMALAMRGFLGRFSTERGVALEMRIGVHSGDVVAGVIGRRKFSYDLWGDTVNTASRMESHGAPGRIQVSAATRALLGPQFQLEERGPIAIKGKGEMTTFWLEA